MAWAFFALMAILCVLDIKKRLIPNLIVIPATIIAAIAFKTYIPVLIAFGLAILLYNRGFWSGGDVKLSAMIGAFMGFTGIIAVALGVSLAMIYGRIKHLNVSVTPFMLVAVVVIKIGEYIL